MLIERYTNVVKFNWLPYAATFYYILTCFVKVKLMTNLELKMGKGSFLGTTYYLPRGVGGGGSGDFLNWENHMPFRGDEGGLVFFNRVWRGYYGKLNANEGGLLEFFRAVGGSSKFHCDITKILHRSPPPFPADIYIYIYNDQSCWRQMLRWTFSWKINEKIIQSVSGKYHTYLRSFFSFKNVMSNVEYLSLSCLLGGCLFFE